MWEFNDQDRSPYLDKPTESAERLLQERFRKLGLFPEAFSSIQYRGTRTYNPPTDFSGLLRSLEQQLDNNTTRSPRSASVIYKALQVEMHYECVNVNILGIWVTEFVRITHSECY